MALNVPHKIQACLCRILPGQASRPGLAFLNSGWGSYDVDFIVDATTGQRLASVWSYDLQPGPLSFIDFGYQG